MSDLPDPRDLPDAEVVVYDGDCRFCRNQVETIAWLDGRRHFAYLPQQDARVAERYPDLDPEQLHAQMYVIGSEGERLGGADGVRRIAWRIPWLWPLAAMMSIPFTGSFWQWGYRLVANNRYRLMGRTGDCDGDSCQLPT